jgi:hypothetical protein
MSTYGHTTFSPALLKSRFHGERSVARSRWRAAETTGERVSIEFPEIIEELATGTYPALLVRGFFDPADCGRIVARLTGGADAISQFCYPMFDGNVLEVKKVGPFLMQYLNARERYFAEARRADALFDAVFSQMPDPRARVRALVAQLMPRKRVSVADEDGIRYSSAVVRVHGDGDGAPVHRDKALVDAHGWRVSQLTTQLSAVLCLQKPERGGQLVMYRRMWTAEDEAHKARGTLGYPKTLVQDSESCTIPAREGDLYMINPSLFHEIKATQGQRRRMTLGTFFGFANTAPEVLFWS